MSHSKKEIKPYSKGFLTTSPFLYYLLEKNYYKSYGSGYNDYGIMINNFQTIPTNSLVRIEIIDIDTHKITYIVEHNYSEEQIQAWCDDDFDDSFIDNAICQSIYFSMKPVIKS